MTSLARRIGSLAVAVTIFAPMQVAALDPAECVFETREGAVTLAANVVNDLGQGFVVQTFQTSDRPAASIDIIDHCPTGQRIVSELANIGDYLVTTDNARPTPREVLQAAMAAPQVYSLEDVAAMIIASGTPATLVTLTQESCGCAVYYPTDRGDRARWARP